MRASAPRLFPAPRELERSGEGCAPVAPVAARRDASLPGQGFEVAIGPGGVRIAYADDAGRRYAEQSLQALRRQFPAALPGLRLRDWPDFPVRGYMLDVSRDRVPTRETLERLVERLALCRLNQLQLYTEHTFAYRDHEVVWRDASPLTADDVRWLDALCRDRGIELVANQNCFGHMGRWLRHDAYRQRAESPEGSRGPRGQHLAASVLEPTEDNARFALGLVDELMACFTSRRINIGCDETFELGEGRSRAAVAARGRGRVYLEHLRRLLDALHARGREVLFWGDIVRSTPELVSELPRRDSVALAWHYEAPFDPRELPESLRELLRRYGFTPGGFREQVPAFADAGFPFWVCPGTSTWNALVGRLSNARANLLDAAEVGLARGAGGYLVTDWGDNGHLQPPCVSLAPIAYGAAVCWNAAGHRDLALAPLLDEWIFEDAAGGLGRALELAGEAYRGTGQRGVNASPLQVALLAGGTLGALGEVDEAATWRTLERLGEARALAERSRPACADGEIARRELLQAIRLARHGAWRLLRGAGFASPGPAELRRDLAEAIEEQRACWLARSRPGGLEDSLARLEATLASYPA